MLGENNGAKIMRLLKESKKFLSTFTHKLCKAFAAKK